jgi:hypothetical protein
MQSENIAEQDICFRKSWSLMLNVDARNDGFAHIHVTQALNT